MSKNRIIQVGLTEKQILHICLRLQCENMLAKTSLKDFGMNERIIKKFNKASKDDWRQRHNKGEKR